jgi:hypothetical protein
MAAKKKAAKPKIKKAKTKTKSKAKPKKAAKKKAPAKKKPVKKPKKAVAKKKSKPKKKKPVPKKKAAPKKKPSPKGAPRGTAKSAAAKTAVPKKKKAPLKKKARTARAPVEIPVDIKFNMATKIQRQKDVAWRMIDGEAVIVTPADSTMHTLNDVGTRIWELMTGNRSLQDVANILCTEFDVDKDRAEKDTIWFAECLAKKGLVEGR